MNTSNEHKMIGSDDYVTSFLNGLITVNDMRI